MMKIASNNYMPELGILDDLTLFQQYPMDSFANFDNFETLDSTDDFFHDHHFNFNLETNSKSNCFPVVETPSPPHYNQQSFITAPAARPMKKQKTSSNTSCSNNNNNNNNNSTRTPINELISTPNNQPKLISFDQSSLNAPPSFAEQFYNLGYDIKPELVVLEERDILANYDHNRPNQTMRTPTQAQDHVMAERKRREKLTRSFIALSAIVPGLKKMDKASVLGDAIKYLKQLQEKVQSLEDQAAKKNNAVLVKKSIIFADNDDSSSDDTNCDHEIEVRVSRKDILIKIQCDKLNGGVAALLGELEKHHQLTVHSSSFMPFGSNIVDVTIVAQMNKENSVTAKDLLGSLRQALKRTVHLI